ncbi:tol-pal system protein YbgF [Pseudorhodoplanes sp.]|uniref:tol-pal system protein YbgF n=1 Tax=Pseudorhodoplanes sp. TaxID=1934341 RepID=UPI002C8242C0|nr:tol-pal system protein YbgF [Pseudorhodoplanes sp.]HWV55251.1 tol-pal system protein YbgF [Pseudorhodoplanes sp.]
MRKPHLIVMALSFLLAAALPAAAQMSASDLVMRLEALENQVRQLTGQIEQLQFRNQQLEQQLRAGGGAVDAPRVAQPPQRAPIQQAQPPLQQQMAAPGRRPEADLPPIDQGADPRFAGQRAPDARYGVDPRAPAADPRYAHRDNPTIVPNIAAAPAPGGRRGDAFDPNATPNAPGAPRPLGALPPGQPSAPSVDVDTAAPGAPLDLTVNDPSRRGGALPPPPQRQMSGTGMAAVQPSGNSPRDHFDLGVGYIRQKDYSAAELTFRDFLQRFPSDRLAADANYWLGESLYNRRQYQDAAEAYLVVTTKYETAARAPDALLRLGQSLAAIRQKEMACASFAEIGRKYPRASVSVKQTVEREQKRVGC